MLHTCLLSDLAKICCLMYCLAGWFGVTTDLSWRLSSTRIGRSSLCFGRNLRPPSMQKRRQPQRTLGESILSTAT